METPTNAGSLSGGDLPSPGPLRERLGRLGRLVRKELLEILRDRRTIITLFLMPVLLYPLLSIAFQQFFLASRVALDQPAMYKIGFPDGLDPNALALFDQLLKRGQPKGKAGSQDLPYGFFPTATLEQDVRDGGVHVGLQPRPRRKGAREGDFPPAFDVLYYVNSPTSRAAVEFIERRLNAFYSVELHRRLRFLPDKEGLIVLRTLRVPLSDPKGSPLVSLTALVPLILILMTITGAVYPAIDLTAGERERGTLEILVAAPVPRLGLLFAKYVTVLTIAVLTALINLTMMTATLVISPIGQKLFGATFSPLLIVQMFGLLLLFAAFFSAVLLTLTSFARSFKEAQAYLIPLMLLALAPGLIGMLPGIKLEGSMTVIPLLNIVLMGRDLFEGTAEPGVAGIVVLSTALYALAAIAVAARIFGSESVLYSEQSSWGDLFRRPAEPQAAPTITAALLTLALMFPCWLVIQHLTTYFEMSIAIRLALVPFLSVVLFLGLPGFAAAMGRVRFTTGFQLQAFSPLVLFAAVLLGVSLWPVVLQALDYLKRGSLRLEQFQEIMGALSEIRQAPLPVKIAIFVVPALVEEVFFRGFLFSALRSRTGPAATIGISALAFGFFHVVTEAFGFERFLPSTALGLILGWVCWKSGSVVPSMVLHGLHNGLLVAFGQSGVSLSLRVAAGGAAGAALPLGEPSLPWTWVAGGAGAALAGLALITWFGKGFAPEPRSD